MDPSVDRAVHRGAIAVISVILAIVTLTSLVLANPSWRDRARRQLGWTTYFAVGSASGLPPEWHESAKPTVVIFVSGACAACRQASPFHRALRSSGQGAGLRVVTALTSTSDDPAAYAGSESQSPHDVVRFDATGSRLRLIPTILIIDRNGVVIEEKEGVLPEAEQHALIARVWSLK
jgi:hypothetical protein